ncbi:hypothetical protein SARC_02934 [Sphaeroforma arctica JP610]|uniref:Uncharacterized protein n=1 Tax=Sphaeroforma arctica JP610 TaxID=667725 RepID=A0A0L0G738_9EUKA|nr:hypothetical protein SARC_02934 [Sphaeroforma arctica JP610]KNC84852.1 hypothetical protein SARC_02934 [Sphaeroforma arctica JP610]|eukprot:XP_014158754.1 hypothetical protein SARC_02934 [Sphaeroforma arctica JP610]
MSGKSSGSVLNYKRLGLEVSEKSWPSLGTRPEWDNNYHAAASAGVCRDYSINQGPRSTGVGEFLPQIRMRPVTCFAASGEMKRENCALVLEAQISIVGLTPRRSKALTSRILLNI